MRTTSSNSLGRPTSAALPLRSVTMSHAVYLPCLLGTCADTQASSGRSKTQAVFGSAGLFAPAGAGCSLLAMGQPTRRWRNRESAPFCPCGNVTICTYCVNITIVRVEHNESRVEPTAFFFQRGRWSCPDGCFCCRRGRAPAETVPKIRRGRAIVARVAVICEHRCQEAFRRALDRLQFALVVGRRRRRKLSV